MIYPYHCPECEKDFDVVKAVADYQREERCECGAQAKRVFTASVHFSGTAVTHAEFNPAFGQVVKNKRHKDYLMKSKGVVEIGNDFKSGESLQKHYDTERAQKRARSWEQD